MTTAPSLGTRLGVLRAIGLSHFAIDIFNSMGPVVVAYLRSPLEMSGAQLGFAIGAYQFLAGATQPPFGWLVDRWGRRWLAPLGMLWVFSFVCAALWVADQWASYVGFVSLFAVAALGSGAFHPHGTMLSSQVVPERESTTTAIFFLCGNLGLGVGPMAAGLALDFVGLGGIYLLAVLLAPISLYLLLALAPSLDLHGSESAQPRAEFWGVSAALLLVIYSLRGWMYIGTMAFLPVLFQGKGWSPSQQGFVVGLFSFGAGIGGVLCGLVGDRLGRRRAMFATTVSAAAFLYVLPGATGAVTFPLAFATGLLVGSPHSVLMVMSQLLLPVRRGLSSGLALGYFFAIGAAASGLIGWLSDRFDLERVLQIGSLLALAHAVLALLLPSTRGAESSPALSTVPAEEL